LVLVLSSCCLPAPDTLEGQAHAGMARMVLMQVSTVFSLLRSGHELGVSLVVGTIFFVWARFIEC
jgi:hypothetical protein